MIRKFFILCLILSVLLFGYIFQKRILEIQKSMERIMKNTQEIEQLIDSWEEDLNRIDPNFEGE
jgi:hypothetical protein